MKPVCILILRFFVGFVVAVSVYSSLYNNSNFMDSAHGLDEWSNDWCFTELSSVNYKISLGTNYKDEIGRHLEETEKQQKLEKDRYLEIIRSGFAMNEQYIICQSQLKDLKSQCSIIRVVNYKLRKEDKEN